MWTLAALVLSSLWIGFTLWFLIFYKDHEHDFYCTDILKNKIYDDNNDLVEVKYTRIYFCRKCWCKKFIHF